MNVTTVSRFELASRVALDASTGSWFVVGVDNRGEAAALAEELEILVESEVPMVSVNGRESLITGSQDHETGIVVFFAPIPLQELHLDDARSLLQREHAAILIISALDLAQLLTAAPHFTSWVGNRAFLVEEDRYLDSVTQAERLAALREHYGMSDEEFLDSVVQSSLALDPEHAEWLVLLGRADLLGDDR